MLDIITWKFRIFDIKEVCVVFDTGPMRMLTSKKGCRTLYTRYRRTGKCLWRSWKGVEF